MFDWFFFKHCGRNLEGVKCRSIKVDSYEVFTLINKREAVRWYMRFKKAFFVCTVTITATIKFNWLFAYVYLNLSGKSEVRFICLLKNYTVIYDPYITLCKEGWFSALLGDAA